jgi:hypothetical protein
MTQNIKKRKKATPKKSSLDSFQEIDYNKSIVEVVHTDKKGYKITLKALEKLIEQSITLGKNPIIIIGITRNDKELFLLTVQVKVESKEH